jgi:hypothetical protein
MLEMAERTIKRTGKNFLDQERISPDLDKIGDIIKKIRTHMY